MTMLSSFVGTITRPALLIMFLSVAATCLCVWQGWSGDLPQPLVATAVIFPIAFSINAAYTRRAEALACQSSIASNVTILFFAHRDWPAVGGEVHARRCLNLVIRLLNTIRDSMKDSTPAVLDVAIANAYGIFSEFSSSLELLRKAGVSSSEISHTNQYLRSIIQDVERMRRLLQYRTPTSLRTYTKTFLYGLPILLGPYFAYLSVKHGIGVGIFVAILYSLILVALDRVQELLENPFDGLGAADDVNVDVGQFYASVLKPTLLEALVIRPEAREKSERLPETLHEVGLNGRE